MGKGSAPPPPDYAAANREGVLTGVELLPLQKQIEAAAKMGTKISYKDPRTGETIQIKASKKLRFTASKVLKEAVMNQ